jgi:hypothetical protein
MSRTKPQLILLGLAALLLAVVAAVLVWMQSSTEYVPIVIDNRQQLVTNPFMLTPGHLDRLEVVLKRYGEWYQRVDATHLRISRELWRDRDLLWNYTTKAEDGGSAGG